MDDQPNPKDELLGKTDALIRRRRNLPRKESLPVLTEEVDGKKFSVNQHAFNQSLTPLPSEIAKSVEDWLAQYLPQAIERQMDDFVRRIAQDVEAALRNHLLHSVRDKIKKFGNE